MSIYLAAAAVAGFMLCVESYGFNLSFAASSSIQQIKSRTTKQRAMSTRRLHSNNRQNSDILPPADVDYTGEVIGAQGRIGSFLVKSGCGFYAPLSNSRECEPGSKTREGAPIFVSVPATQIGNGK